MRLFNYSTFTAFSEHFFRRTMGHPPVSEIIQHCLHRSGCMENIGRQSKAMPVVLFQCTESIFIDCPIIIPVGNNTFKFIEIDQSSLRAPHHSIDISLSEWFRPFYGKQ